MEWVYLSMRCTTKISAPAAGFHIYTTKFSAPAAGLCIYTTKISAPAAGLCIYTTKLSAHEAGFHIYTSNTKKISTPVAGLYTHATNISGLISNSFFIYKRKGEIPPPILRRNFDFHGGGLFSDAVYIFPKWRSTD